MGEVNETGAGNQKKETLAIIPPTPIENQRLNTGKSLLIRDAQEETTMVVPKRKKALEDSNSVSKRGSRHG